MFDFEEELEPECKYETFRIKEFNLFKEHKKQIIKFLKNNDSKDNLSINRNYADYFLKRYVIGSENWSKLVNFNKYMLKTLKSDKYKTIIESMLNNTSISFDVNNYLFRIEPSDIKWNFFKSKCLTLSECESSNTYLENDLFNRPDDYDVYFDKDYFCFETDFWFTPVSKFHSILHGYMDDSNVLRTIRYRIIGSNYRDRNGKLHQVLTLNSVEDHDSISADPIVSIIFYYNEDNISFTTTDEEPFNFINFQKYSVDLCYQFCGIKSYTTNSLRENRIHIYHCDKPVFNELQQKILRTFYWINTRSRIEHMKCYNDGDMTATAKYFHDKIHSEDDFMTEYPMYVDNYFKIYKDTIIDSDLTSQWFTQLFFKTINECLNNIENNHHDNSYEQDESYKFENYNSSVHSLGALYLKNNVRQEWKMGILDTIQNYNMIMLLERILHDHFPSRNND